MITQRRRLSAIGLDIGERTVFAAQLRVAGRGGAASIGALARMARPAAEAGGAGLDPAWLRSMLDSLERQGFVGNRYVVAMAQGKLLSGVLDVPARESGAPLDVICRNELARTHRLSAEEIESAWWELPAPPAGMRAEAEGLQAAAVGCRVSDAEGLLGAFEGAGADVRAIDARGPALARAVGGRALAAPALTAVLEWSWESALILILRGGQVVYERARPESGLGATHSDMVKKMLIDSDAAAHVLEHVGLGAPTGELASDPELIGQAQRAIGEQIDSVALEVRASAAYAARRFGDAVGRVILCGEGACMPEALARLERRLELPVEVAEPGTIFAGDDRGGGVAAPARGSSLVAALGLAGHPLEESI